MAMRTAWAGWRGTREAVRASARQRRHPAALLIALALLGLALAPTASQAAEPPLLRSFCPTGGGAGQCSIPRGVAVDQTSGDVYVADQSNSRIQKFTAWGELLRAWGWEVVASGPHDEAPQNEVQQITVDATGGSYRLEMASSGLVGGAGLQTAPIPYDASAAALQAELETDHPPFIGFDPGTVAVNGGPGGTTPYTIEFTGSLANTEIPPFEISESSLSGGAATVSGATVQDGGSFELCVPAEGDVCKRGQESSSAGGFHSPQGLALDSVGALYVIDWRNLRVQKFGPEGEFLLTFGGEVNRTKVEEGKPEAQRNLCPVDPGDECQGGTQGTGEGQFGDWKLGSYVSIDRKGTATAADDVVYVGDEGRVQTFDSGGHYLADLPDPDKVIEEGGPVNSLAVDQNTGSVYLGFVGSTSGSKPGLEKLSSAGESQCTIEAHNPRAIAVAADGDVYVVDGEIQITGGAGREILRFNSSCGGREVLFGPERSSTAAENEFTTNPTGIATSSACGIDGTDLIVSNSDSGNSFVKLFGPPPTDIEPPCSSPPLVPPTVSETYTLSVGATGATVRAAINPHFWNDATYRVQYASAACIEAEGGWAAPCVKEQPSGSGVLLSDAVFDEDRATKGIFLGASVPLGPDTEYRYRFLATSSGGSVEGPEASFRTYPLPSPAKLDCPNQAFRTGASAHLPDCRAYELVSPPDKEGNEVGLPGKASQAATDGQALSFSGGAFAEPEAAPSTSQYVAERNSEGWSTRAISPPRSGLSLSAGENFEPRYRVFSEDLCLGWLLQDTDVALVEGAPAGVVNLYRRLGLRSGCPGAGYQLLTTVFPPSYDPPAGLYYPQLQGFSADGEVSIYRAPAALSSDACQVPTEAGPQGRGIFQVYLSREGSPGFPPRLISILPDGQAACTHSSVGTAQGFQPSDSTSEDSLHHAVSRDAARIYWTATQSAVPPQGALAQAGREPGELYVRINALQPQSVVNKAGKCTEAAKACTYPVSEEAEALSGTSESRFLDAAADGSAAIFSTGEDLYAYDLAKALAKEAATSLIAHGVKGILGASEDASRLYLVSTEDLDAGASAGEPNLYLHERGAGFDFVATLGGPFDSSVGDVNSAPSSVGILPESHLSRVSPDGLHAAFIAADPALAESVAGYDNADVASGRPAREVYLYDATANEGAGKLACASCNPSGARPAARLTQRSSNNPNTWIYSAAVLPGWITSMHPGNALSSDGKRLFFESFEALVLRDTNGVADVYQWQAADSKAQCLNEIGGELFVPVSGGCLSLISSGTSSTDSQLIDASPSGDDVFIRTEASLLPQDPGVGDAYDARAGGGFPPPAEIGPGCEGEACAPPPSPPDDPTPASASFQGPGDLRQGNPRSRCPKGKRSVTRRGKPRCVPRKRKASAQRKRRANAERRAGR